MKLAIIAGFLGSGKTTLLLGLVRRLVGEDGLDFVILENEVGEVGIDGAGIGEEEAAALLETALDRYL